MVSFTNSCFIDNFCFRLTVFASEHIPINIVETVEASAFYRQYLGSTLLGIPMSIEERLLHWPVLKPKDIRSLGTGQRQSCADVVLSSVGKYINDFKSYPCCLYCVICHMIYHMIEISFKKL